MHDVKLPSFQTDSYLCLMLLIDSQVQTGQNSLIWKYLKPLAFIFLDELAVMLLREAFSSLKIITRPSKLQLIETSEQVEC